MAAVAVRQQVAGGACTGQHSSCQRSQYNMMIWLHRSERVWDGILCAASGARVAIGGSAALLLHAAPARKRCPNAITSVLVAFCAGNAQWWPRGWRARVGPDAGGLGSSRKRGLMHAMVLELIVCGVCGAAVPFLGRKNAIAL